MHHVTIFGIEVATMSWVIALAVVGVLIVVASKARRFSASSHLAMDRRKNWFENTVLPHTDQQFVVPEPRKTTVLPMND